MRVPFTGQVILHIGPHKTGTTSIQAFLSSNRNVLSERGILYPDAGRGRIGKPQHWHFGDAIARGDKEYLVKFQKDLSAEIERLSPSTLLFSTEVLSREAIHEDNFRTIREIFDSAQIKILLFLRRQDSLLASRYAEHLKKGGRQRIEDFQRGRILDHLKRIERIMDSIEGCRVVLFPFELCKGRLEKSIMDFLEIPMKDEHLYIQETMNPSLPWGGLASTGIDQSAPKPHREQNQAQGHFRRPKTS